MRRESRNLADSQARPSTSHRLRPTGIGPHQQVEASIQECDVLPSLLDCPSVVITTWCQPFSVIAGRGRACRIRPLNVDGRGWRRIVLQPHGLRSRVASQDGPVLGPSVTPLGWLRANHVTVVAARSGGRIRPSAALPPVLPGASGSALQDQFLVPTAKPGAGRKKPPTGPWRTKTAFLAGGLACLSPERRVPAWGGAPSTPQRA